MPPADPLDALEQYWTQRQGLEDTNAAAANALELGHLTQARQLFTKAQEIEQVLGPLAQEVGQPMVAGRTHLTLTQAVERKRAALAQHDGKDAITLKVLFDQLLELEETLFGSVASTRQALLALLAERSERVRARGDLAAAQTYIEMALRYDSQNTSIHELDLIAVLVERASIAREAGQVTEAERDFLNRARLLLDTLASQGLPDEKLDPLRADFEKERLALRRVVTRKPATLSLKWALLIAGVVAIVVLLLLILLWQR